MDENYFWTGGTPWERDAAASQNYFLTLLYCIAATRVGRVVLTPGRGG